MINNILRKALRAKASIRLRNALGIRPIYRRWHLLDESYVASDLFLWRTDSGFQTEFRVSDIMGKYYQQEGKYQVNIFDRLGREVNRLEGSFDEAVERIFINENNASPDSYGTFTVFHLPQELADTTYAITNRCYTGYSRPGCIPSFVHGNLLSRICLFEPGGNTRLISGFITHKRNTDFYIQKDLARFDKSELVFANPLETSILVTIGQDHITLAPGEVRLLDLKISNSDPVRITSDFFFPRPLIFSYRDNRFDVHHA